MNKWYFLITFVLGAFGAYLFNSALPFNWLFCGVVVPAIFGLICTIVALAKNAWDDLGEWAVASFGIAAGALFVLYIYPLFAL